MENVVLRKIGTYREWLRHVYREMSWKAAAIGLIALEILGIIYCQMEIWANKPGAELKEQYQQALDLKMPLGVEINRLETAKQEDLHPVEALAALMSVLPEKVKWQHVTIGDFHNGDWIMLETGSEDRTALENYLGDLRKNPYFSTMKIEDTREGVKVTVPMPESFTCK